MPRDSNGVYTLPALNPVVVDTLISPTWANNTMSDLGAEITGSLPRDGSAAMTGKLKVADGNAAGPPYTFGSDTVAGMYRSASSLGFAWGGLEKFTIGQYKSTHSRLLEVPAIYAATAVNLNVDTVSGSATPLDPLVGNPFNTLLAALTYANNLSPGKQGISITLIAGASVPLTANIAMEVGINFKTTVPGTKATITGLFTIINRANATYTDIQINNNGFRAESCKVTVTSCAGNSATMLIQADYGGAIVFTNAITLTQGSVEAHNNSVLEMQAAFTMSAGKLIARASSVKFLGATSITSLPADSPIDIRYNSAMEVDSDFIITNTAGSALLIYVDNNSNLSIVGTGLLTLNVGSGGTNISCRGRSSVFIIAGRTASLPGAGKAFFANGNSQMTFLTGFAASTYTPALNTVQTNSVTFISSISA